MSKIYLSKKFQYNGKSSPNLSKIQNNAKLEIISNFKIGILKWEINNCRCSFNKDLLICTRDYHGINVSFVLCLNCGIIRENPRISKDTIEIFYEKFYRDLKKFSFSKLKQTSKIGYFEQTYIKETERGKIILNYINKYTPLKAGLIFDFGTGTGGTLKSFKDAGFEIFGIDINEDFLNYGLKKGLNLKKGSIDELKNYPKKANLIIASHILEHLHELDSYLKEIRECLEEDGYLIVLLPGLMNIQDRGENLLSLFIIEHLYYFTLPTLTKILIDNGFRFVNGNEEIIALFQKTTQKVDFEISKDLIDNILIYMRILDLPFPFNAIRIIKNKRKIKYLILLNIISMLYKTKIINIIAILRDFLKQKLKLRNFLNISYTRIS